MSLIAAAELRSYLRAGEQDVGVVGSRDADDAFLELLCEAASLRAEAYTERRFTPYPALPDDVSAPLPDPVTEIVPAHHRLLVPLPDLREVVQITVDDVVRTPDTYTLLARPEEPATLLQLARTEYQEHWLPGFDHHHRCGPRMVTITGYFGFVAPPSDVKLAVLTMAARSFHDAQARLGDRIVDPDGGVTSYFRQLPLEAKAVLDGYRAARPIPML